MPGRDTTPGRGISAGLEARLGLQQAGARAIDSLTSLPNRASFHRILDEIFGDSERSGLALLRIAIDEVAALRKEQGPSAADQLVAAVAGRLRRSVRDGDLSARLKDAEFGLILAAEDVAEAACAAQRVLDRLREPYELSGRLVDVTVSIGISFAGRGSNSAQTLLARAEIALERARATGRGEWRIFRPANAVDPDTQQAMLSDLHDALAAREMTLAFHPVVTPDAFRLTHADVALRWCHPRIGIIESADFIPVINDRGVSDLLAAWTIRNACEIGAAGRHDLTLIVPLSDLSTPDAALVEAVGEALGETAAVGRSLMLAIPEATFRRADPLTISSIAAIRALGVGILLDDVAALPNDLPWIRTLGIDAIRTAASVLEDLENDLHAFTRLQGLTGLAHSLGLTTIARGIRTEEDVEAVRRYGFASLQGPICGAALTAIELSAYARTATPITRRTAGGDAA